MKLDLKELKRAMSVARNVSPSRSPMDIIRYVLVRCSGNRASIFSTDSEVFSVCAVKCEGATGDFCIPTDKLSDVISASKVDPEFRVSGNEVLITMGKTKMRIPTVDPATFPAKISDDQPVCKISGSLLARCMDVTIPAQGSHLTLAINGLNFKSIDGKLHVRGADGYIFVSAETDVPCKDINEVIPTKAVRAIRALLDEDEIQFRSGASTFMFSNSWARVSGPYLAGKFPPCEKFFSEIKWTSKFDCDELRALCAQAKILSEPETLVSCKLAMSKSNVKFTASTTLGSMDSEFALVDEDGKKNEITVGIEHLNRILLGDKMWIADNDTLVIRNDMEQMRIQAFVKGRVLE